MNYTWVKGRKDKLKWAKQQDDTKQDLQGRWRVQIKIFLFTTCYYVYKISYHLAG